MIKELVKSTKRNAGKSKQTSGNKYYVTLSYKDKKVNETFHDNYKNESGTDNFLYALLMDGNSYDNCYNFADFCNEFGYDGNNKKDLTIYNACKKQSEKLHYLFTNEEIEQLNEEFQDF